MILFTQVADTYETALDRAIADNAESTPMHPIEGACLYACLYMGFGYTSRIYVWSTPIHPI